jgi:two-component system LytT family response regulator
MNKSEKSTTLVESIPAVIVEDEVRSQKTLHRLINSCCPEVRVDGFASTVKEATGLINLIKPPLIFLDIALPDGDGFSVLEQIDPYDYQVIFVTAYEKYAIRAIEFSALHYLLKPVSQTELEKALLRFKKTWKHSDEDLDNKLKLLKHNLLDEEKKILLPTTDGYEVIALDEIIRLEASHNYTYCFHEDQRKTIVSRPLLSFEKILDDLPFARIHSKYIINLKFLKKYVRGSGGTVIMADRTEINVSKGRKGAFLEKLETYARKL